MKNLSELTDFYYKNLYPTLQELEVQRKALLSRLYKVAGVVALLASTIAFFLFKNNVPVDAFMFLGFALVVVGGILYKYLIKDYTSAFKEGVIRPLIGAIDTNLNYSPLLSIPNHHFSNSKLFSTKPDRMSGNDLVRGTIDGVKIEFSDFHAEKRHTNSKGQTSWSTLFQGLFIVSEFPKHFKGTTVVLPDTAESTFGEYIGSFLQSNNFSRGELIKMDNPVFEKEFVVYGDDQIESRYILTPALMELLLAFKKRTKEKMFISFTSNRLYLAIAYNKDLFEPSVFHSLLKYKIAMEYISTLHLAIGIVEELKLNQKLWSKS